MGKDARELRSSAAWLLIGCRLLAADPSEFFEMRIRPLLAKNCYTCHTTAKLGGLQLTSRENILKGGNSGPAILPGKPEESLLIQAVSQTHERVKMPPQGKLKDEEIEDLKTWVRAGAVWPDAKPIAPVTGYVITAEQRAFWSFQPVRKPAVPVVREKAWVRSPIDAFILARLERDNLKPARPAGKRALIRRASFDLIGLPPTPEEVDAFLRDNSPDAFRKVVDRLLASPHYGERWGRYWLDVARYSDDRLNSTNDDPYPNAFRYRDWVIQAFNDDMPYDLFIKSQVAGDLLGDKEKDKLAAGLGFYGMSPEFQDDRVDATTRGFLGLTVACAQCHDHKFDPIPTKDYYSLLGVFESTELHEYPLAPAAVVEKFDQQKKKVKDQEASIKDFLDAQGTQLAEIFAASSARYLLAAWKILGPDKEDVFTAARAHNLDPETLERLVDYLRVPRKEHSLLDSWQAAGNKGAAEADIQKRAREFQELLLSVNKEKKSIDEKNLIRLGGSTDREVLSSANLLSLPIDRYVVWRDFFSDQRMDAPYTLDSGVFRYNQKKIERFLAGEWKAHLENMRAELESLKAAMPPPYPFLHAIKDSDKPHNIRIHIRGSADNLGDEAPRRFLSILSAGEPTPFQKGSGRLELAEAIASAKNPLTARVMVNRIWQQHFGYGIVRTPSNFGQMGERPTHPELLDYLAAQFVENNWSIKAMHREIMLSAAYALSTERMDKNLAIDPDNRLLWRANRRRLDIEALRDALLYASGKLDLRPGGEPMRLTEEKNYRRTIYGFVSRRRLDGTLSLFDFPNPNNTSEARLTTNTPVQRLFFLNSNFVMRQADALAARLVKDAGEDRQARIRRAYRLLYNRDPSPNELSMGVEFVKDGEKAWPRYAQVLLTSNEFCFLN